MKRSIIAIVISSFFTTMSAQDIIVKKDGSVIQAKVSEIGTSEIKYKKWSNQDGPTYAITKGEILAITYQNGEKEMFNNTPVASNQTSTQQKSQLIERPTATNNASLIAKYDKNLKFKNQGKIGKEIKSAIGVFAFGDNSVLSNDDIEIQFVLSRSTSPSANLNAVRKTATVNSYLLCRYCIVVKNKTNNTIYVDLANCTRLNKKTMEASAFYKDETVSVSHGSSSTVGLGGFLGGAGVGIGFSNSTTGSSTRTYNNERIVSIPPQSFKVLKDFKLSHIKNEKCELVSRGEEFIFGMSTNNDYWGEIEYQNPCMPYGIIKENEIINYSLEHSPLSLEYRITYSNNTDFSNYSVATANLFLKELIGFPSKYVGQLYVWSKNTPSALKTVDEYFDGYDQDTIWGLIVLDK